MTPDQLDVGMMKTCSKCKTTRPRSAFKPAKKYRDGLHPTCKPCVAAMPSQTRKRLYTEPRAVRNRARHRATERLIDTYRDQFEAFYEEELARASEETTALKEASAAAAKIRKRDGKSVTLHAGHPEPEPPPTPLLKPGRRGAGQEVTDRIREDVGTCPVCIGSHDRKHRCPACGERPDAPWIRSANARGGRA